MSLIKPSFSIPLDNSELIEVGQWYLVAPVVQEPTVFIDDDGVEEISEPELGETEFACVVHIGSNYYLMKGPHYEERIHVEQFNARCTQVKNPDVVIQDKVAYHQAEISGLLLEVQALTDRLALTTSALSDGTESTALVVASEVNVATYTDALVLAKKKTFPELLSKIESANKSLASWLTASVIPLKAKTSGLKGMTAHIEERIFNVELYAGLIEKVVLIRDGEPAAISEPVHLMQRLCYMDEECLAQYEVGGMDIGHLADFDRWLAKPDNFTRLLPFTRCVTAFRVRRDKKERDCEGCLFKLVQIMLDEEDDKTTFLYLRNGDKLYRLTTSHTFEAKLFPDLDSSVRGTSKLYAKIFAGRISDEPLISEGAYLAMVAEEECAIAEAKRLRKKAAQENKWQFSDPWTESQYYVPFDSNTVCYDDISESISNDVRKHNRLVLILQGLLDRSPVFHPHPPWKLWDPAGFQSGLRLVYDDSRALVAGEAPDFETYRARLNALIVPGSITVGQQRLWLLKEGEKESNRLDRDWRTKATYRPTTFQPYGNPGPGMLAQVVSRTKKDCTYEWNRKRLVQKTWKDSKRPFITSRFTVSLKGVLNVSAYTPGDFKQFFNDPRTRAAYLKWAPLLLDAEEYHAGNCKVGDD